MKKLTVLALVASLSLAAPALAQTPADIKNFRDYSATSYVDEPVKEEVVATPVKETKKSKKSKTSSKSETKTETKTDTKAETKTEKTETETKK